MTKKYDPNIMPFEGLQYHGSQRFAASLGGQHYQNYRQKVLKFVEESKLPEWKLHNFLMAVRMTECPDFINLVEKYSDKLAYYYDNSYITFQLHLYENGTVIFKFEPLRHYDNGTVDLIKETLTTESLLEYGFSRYGGCVEINSCTDKDILKILEIYFERSAFIMIDTDDFITGVYNGGTSLKYKDFCKYVDFVKEYKALPDEKIAVVEEAAFNAANSKYPPNKEVYYFMRTNKEGKIVLMRDIKKSPKKENPSAPARK